jgi:predicted enzyme related to lactoylglutathione lyase
MPHADRIGELGWIQTDSEDPDRLAKFWGAVFGVEVEARLGDPPRFVNLAPVAPGFPRVCFQRVPEPKTVKNRLHFDVWVEDVEEACLKVEALGATRRDVDDFHEFGYSWRRMSDPEGHEFCLIYNTPRPT